MSYTHNMDAQYRDVALAAREDMSEGRKEFYKLFGAAGFSVLAAAACGGGGSTSLGGGSAGVVTPGGDTSSLSLNDYETILAPQAAGWKYLSVLRDDYIYMNYGTTGSIPASVLNELATWHKDVAYSPAGPLSWQVTNTIIRADASKAIYGCLPQEMFVSFNTTDGMIKVISSIKWNNKDVVLMTNNEHPGGLGPIHMVANRFGLQLKEVNVPTGSSKGPGTGGYAEDGTMVARFEAARQDVANKGYKVRAIMISSPPYTLGWRLEEKELCLWAASHNILSIVDGAHIPGAMPIDLHDMGCDYFAGTAAKWQCGPGQTGYAYVRGGKKGENTTLTFNGRVVSTNDWTNPNDIEPYYIDSASYKHFPGYVGYQGKWDLQAGQDLGAAIVSTGNPNYPTLKILYEVNKVWDSIGRTNIAKYNQSLAQYLRQKVAQSDKMGLYSLGVDFQTPQGVVPTGRADETEFPRYLQTGLTAINPFGPNKDFNDPLTAAQSTAEAAACSAAINRISREYGIVIRSISTKHQLRSNPAVSARDSRINGQALDAGQKTNSTPLRVSTHLYTTVPEVDRLVDALNTVL